METSRPMRWIIPALAFAWWVLAAQAPAQTPLPTAPNDLNWWKNAVIYEIYPRSFGDTNGDGIGDLNGVTRHLDYLEKLGINAIWLTPFYPSPQVDFGYDISDYRAIDPQYGTMADFDRLVSEAAKHRIRIITDLVLNHTSDRHPWFVESRSSRTNSKADWYIWAQGKPNRQPPNNWLSLFGHSAWQYDPPRDQFYYHEFYKEQPDLNWRNPKMRDAMYDTVRFWMRRGVAGFRLDAITFLFEDPRLRDEPFLSGTTPYGDRQVSDERTNNLPEVHDVLRQLRRVTNEFPGRVLIGETYVSSAADLRKMYGANNDELQLPMDTQYGFINRLDAAAFRSKLKEAETDLGGNVPLFVFDNHDNRRSWDRYGDGAHNEAIAKLIATLLLAPRGTALLYYGQEIGMQNTDPKSRDQVKDPIGKIGWPKEVGRDGERTPMQWDDSRNAGFSDATSTWLPLSPDFRDRNVSKESQDPKSLLNYYRSLIRLRTQNSALRDGNLTLVSSSNQNVLAFARVKENTTVLVALNLSGVAQTTRLDLAACCPAAKKLATLVSSFDVPAAGETLPSFSLPPFGAFIAEIH